MNLATTIHDMRQMANTIAGFAHMLQHELHEPAQLEKARRIFQSARKLSQLASKVSDKSLLEAERLVLQDVSFNADRLTEDVHAMLCVRAVEKRLWLEVENDAQLATLAVFGDELQQIRQVLYNLADNAIKYTNEGGIQLRAQVLSVDAGRARLRFEVVDTGIGMTPAQQASIFVPYAPGRSRHDPKFRGMGLGLAVSHRFVENLRGKIGVSSQPGYGSTFWFEVTLRCVTAESQSAAAGTTTAADTATNELPRVIERQIGRG